MFFSGNFPGPKVLTVFTSERPGFPRNVWDFWPRELVLWETHFLWGREGKLSGISPLLCKSLSDNFSLSRAKRVGRENLKCLESLNSVCECSRSLENEDQLEIYKIYVTLPLR